MAVAFVFEGTEVGTAEYDRVMGAINREDLNSPIPTGVIAHIAGPSENGWRVVDVWESQEAAQAFYGSDLFQAAVSTLPPLSITPWALHRLEVYETLRRKD